MKPYIIDFSNRTENGSITIAPGTIDRSSTSLSLLGPNAPGYGTTVAQNFLNLLENFSNSSAPANPIEGQLWYDTSNANAKVLRILDESTWQPVNGIYQQSFQPSNAHTGDVWVDTVTFQIKICSGPNTWVTIGTDFTQGSQTGFDNTVIDGTDGKQHSVILSYLNGEVLTILAKESFKPISVIDGFDNLVPGLNFSTKAFDGTVAKMSGLATEAAALRVTTPVTQTISANFFLRKDIPQSLKESLIIDNNTGLRIGATSSTFLLQKFGNDGSISSISPGSKIKLSITDTSNVSQALITLDGGSKQVGIGAGNINPEYTLDVSGTMRVTGAATLTNSLTIGKELLATTATFAGTLSVNGTSTFNNSLYSNSIIPATAGTNLFTIGSPDRPFKNIYAQNIGSTSTQFFGNAASATKLANTTTFQLQGQVSSDVEIYNGTAAVIFDASLTELSITDQLTTSTVSGSQMLLVANTSTLYKVTKTDFLADIAPGLASSGMILPWAGDVVPTGWAFCDGATYNQSGIYNSLFSVIGVKYGSTAPGTFQVPNLTPLTATGPVTVKYIIRI